MKPAVTKFPVVDCNYHSATLTGFNGRCGKTAPSFLNISREYFRSEARHNFIEEAVCFALMIATSALSFAIGAYTIFHLCRAVGAL